MSVWENIKAFFSDFAHSFFKETGLVIMQTLCILVIGLVVINIVQIIARSAALRSRRLDRAASSFVLSILSVILYLSLAIAVVSALGFSTAGIIAAFSAVALAVALALKDSLGSLANGVIIIFTKPFQKGDYVEIGGLTGLVREIRLFNTKIVTYNNETIIVPNSEVLGSKLINYSSMPLRRVVFDFNVPLNADVECVKRVVLQGVKGIPTVVEMPAPSVVLSDFKESTLLFSVRVWTPNETYWDSYFGVRDSVLSALRGAGIEVAYQRLEVALREAQELQNGGKEE